MTYEVWIDRRPVGSFTVDVRPGFQNPSMTFSYLDEWLSDDRGFAISPDLPLQRGPHTPAAHRTTFLSFDDAAPDRWGRGLLEAGMRQQAIQRGIAFKSPTEIDLLLAVDDETRQGALRFRKDDKFLAVERARASIQELPMLARAAQRFADSGEIDSEVLELIGVGSSPGGAQPKAWVRDEDGAMHLAKFPRTSDVVDVSAWELAVIKLQRRAGIRVQPSSTFPLKEEQSVFLTRRFDRDGNRRIPYMSFKSAFAVAEYDRPDYATLARKVAAISAKPRTDAAELFSRAALTAMVHNIDDHMRNHGLLRDGSGWRLSPSFDVTPSRSGSSNTPLTPEDDPRDRDIRLLVNRAEDFRLTRDEAVRRIQVVDEAVSRWREDAVASGVAADALDSMSTAFEGENRARAADLRGEQKVTIDLAPAPGLARPVGDVWVKPHTRRGRFVEGHYRRRAQ
ncbi:type II toxin-antitoxin system HipA family toxin [Specibacter cremeus]|uniref:type II toxin-antitoxin system HipA family toxin n=1 Tax=Specibacter cremeus TaxID=1629051 RepID=UPI000F775C7D|nr:type II toxin-antitoxin system HipA family toxin [Specibacter cremeus]